MQKWYLTYPQTLRQLDEEGIIKPGVVIEFDGGKQVVIGHLNEVWGSCDCCVLLRGEQIVNGYCVVWEEASD
jgi:hypothetical protein